MRQHPSDTVHEAQNYFDALNRHEDALRYEKTYLDDYDREHGDRTPTTTFDDAMRQTDAARAMWRTENDELQQAIDRLTKEAKQRAAAEMRNAGLDDVYADACESDDYGLLAI